MPADPGTRDYEITKDIVRAEADVRRLHDQLMRLHDEATSEGAVLHAKEYQVIAEQLDGAIRRLARAHDLMLNFDVEEPKELVRFVYEIHIDAVDDNGDERPEEDIMAEARSRLEELIAQEGLQAEGTVVAGQST